MTDDQIKEAARKAVDYLTSPEGRAELERRGKDIDEYFKWLRKATRPTWESLHRPFDI